MYCKICLKANLTSLTFNPQSPILKEKKKHPESAQIHKYTYTNLYKCITLKTLVKNHYTQFIITQVT